VRSLPVCNPPNRFHATRVDYDEEHVPDAGYELLEDRSQSILSKNDSPDLGFTFSVNPYRGCAHACAYCYARPSHEYLGLGAGTDFDRKIVVKREAPRLLRAAFAKRTWRREREIFSGVTDCYQPAEAELRLTRQCLEVCREFRTPAGIVTKSALVERDLDVLGALHEVAGVHVSVSIPFFDPELARAIEPYAASPSRRLRTIERLARAGLPVGVNVAPLVPGVSESQFSPILEAARDAGATAAHTVLLRLPGAVAPVFVERIRSALPLRAEKILRRLREAHGGKLYNSTFGHRQRGASNYATMLLSLFERRAQELGLGTHWPPCGEEPAPPEAAAAATKTEKGPQLRLFE
jgi:DNA repair photolyase